jgi:hypothetical protein
MMTMMTSVRNCTVVADGRSNVAVPSIPPMHTLHQHTNLLKGGECKTVGALAGAKSSSSLSKKLSCLLNQRLHSQPKHAMEGTLMGL